MRSSHSIHRTGRRRVRFALGLVLLAGPALAGNTASAAGGADAGIRKQLDRILEGHGQPRARLGALVVELPSGRVLYDRNAELPLIPASNMKLVVIAAALDQLGRDHRFETRLAIRGDDLVVIGGGDPTIGDERLAKARGERITEMFHTWATRLESAGIRQIPGDIVVDDSIFDRRFVHPNWPAGQYQSWYEAPIGGLNFNANCTSLELIPPKGKAAAGARLIPGNTYLELKRRRPNARRKPPVVSRSRDSDVIWVTGAITKSGILGPVTIRDPGLYFGSILKTVLAARGIRTHGSVVRRRVQTNAGRLPDDCHLVAVHRSPLADALGRAGKNSLGMMAEGLIKTLGARPGAAGSWKNGRAAVEKFMTNIGVPRNQFRVDDGSGLSRENRLSASAAVRVLTYMFKRDAATAAMFRSSLAVSGVDGSLRNRLKTPDVKGRIFAKTGYIAGVRTLAGYVHTHADQWLAFAFFYDNAPATRPMTETQNRACRLLVDYPN